MQALFLKRSAFFFILLGAFTLFGGTALAAAAPTIHVSHNWAGYAASTDTYTGVSATWAVPDSTTTSKDISADAAWVGIGGVKESDLIQVGTQAIIRNGHRTYTAWYELLPATQQMIPVDIAPGDRVFASVNEISPDLWRITLIDMTTNQSYQTSVPYHSSHSSAEWIVERPLAITDKATGYLPLADFDHVTFGNALVTTSSGQMKMLDQSGAEQLVMSDSDSRILAVPQTGQNGSFAVSYLTRAEGEQYLRTLKREYTLRPQADSPSSTPHYEEIDTSFIIHVVFGGSH